MIVNSTYEVLTPTGFQDFEGLKQVTHSKHLKIIFDTSTLVCSMDHRFIAEDQEVIAKNLKSGTKLHNSVVRGVEIVQQEVQLYDLVNVANGHVYFTNNVISHNCDCDFLTSGHTVIPTETLAMWESRADMIHEPAEKRGPSGDYWIWKYPDYSKSYTVVADVARGDGNDYSTFHVFDIEGREQVAEFKGKVDTTTFGRMLVSVSTDYNKALLVIENTGVGWATVQVALDEGYSNLFYSYKNDPFLDESIQLRKNYDLKQKHEMVPGFTNSHKLRPVIISKIETAFQADDFILHSARTLSEFRTFLWINGRPEAQRGYNDDLILPLGTFFYIHDIALKLRQLGVELTKKAITHTRKTIYTSTSKQNDPWNIKVGRDTEQLKWLL